MARTSDLISPYLFRSHELHDPKHRPALKDVRTLHQNFERVQETNRSVVQMLNDAESQIDDLRDQIALLKEGRGCVACIKGTP